MKNMDIREAASKAGVRLWQVADELGIVDNNLSRKLRYELPEGEKARIFAIIDKLSQEADNNAYADN